jgi:replicative DNA helicase
MDLGELICFACTDVELFSRFNFLFDRIKLKDDEKKLVAYSREFFRETQRLPTLAEFKIRFPWTRDLEDVSKEFLDKNLFETLRDELMKDWIIEVADYIEKGEADYGRVFKGLSELRDTLEVSRVRRSSAFDLFDRVVEKSIQDEEMLVSTGINILDMAIGGFARGEITVLIAPPGYGKTCFLVNCVYGALSHRKNVLYVTLELNEDRMAERILRRIALVTRKDLRVGKEKVRETLNRFSRYTKAKCNIAFRKPGTVSSVDVEGMVETLHNVEPIDVLLVDYVDKLKMRGDFRRAVGDAVDDLRLLGERLNIAVTTVTQANRSALSQTIITEEHISESFKKVENADIVLSLCRTDKEMNEGKGRIVVLKNREGRGEKTTRGAALGVVIDYAKALIVGEGI